MDEILAGCRDHGVKHWTADNLGRGSPRRMSRGGGGCYHNAPVVFQ